MRPPRISAEPPGKAEAEIPLPEPVYLHDAELVRSCLAGDNEAWTTLLRRYHQLIYSIPRRYGLDADDAADVYQAVCLALWNGLARLRSEKALTNWILVTTSRQSDRLSKRRKRQRSDADDDDAMVRLPAPETPPLADLEELEEKQRLKQAMARLPQKCSELLTRLYLIEKTTDYDSVAADLGIPRGSIGPTRSRCLDKLKKLLGKRAGS